jgi:hypothetical protein
MYRHTAKRVIILATQQHIKTKDSVTAALPTAVN